MGWARAIFDEIIGLFVDDLGFALAILAWLGACVFLLPLVGLPGYVPALLLVGGLLAILVESAIRRARRR